MSGPEPAPHPAPLRVRGATKSYGGTLAVDGVDLDLDPGELLVLVGPSGCGKSTLLRTIAGLSALDAGTIEVAGAAVDDGRRATPPEQRPVGMVFQDHTLFPHLTLADNVGFGLRRRSATDRRRRVEDLLELVGIGHLARRYPHEVSGGERQRASVARAVAPRPALLLLDEPFAALDPNLREQVRAELVSLLRVTATPAVFVSHDQAEALALGDRLAVMRAGRLVQVGAGPEVYDRPVDRFVARFLGDASFLPVAIDGGRPRTELGPLDLDGGEVAAGAVAVVRPADVTLAPVVGEAVDEVVGEVVDRSYQGPTWTYDLRLPSGSVVRATPPRTLVLERGDRAAVVLRDRRPALVAG
ncbi:MAG: ABC transporter ATP-binding protein [Acidimicrobiales bacterium]